MWVLVALITCLWEQEASNPYFFPVPASHLSSAESLTTLLVEINMYHWIGGCGRGGGRENDFVLTTTIHMSMVEEEALYHAFNLSTMRGDVTPRSCCFFHPRNATLVVLLRQPLNDRWEESA